jgi:hypothetical protein
MINQRPPPPFYVHIPDGGPVNSLNRIELFGEELDAVLLRG